MNNSSKETLDIIRKYNFKVRADLGQNFLIEPSIIKLICNHADISKSDTILEVGPGLGAMTRELAKRSHKVVAVEKDFNIIPILSDILSDIDNVTVINKDILEIDFNKLIHEYSIDGNIKVVANLPYYITTPIVTALIEKAKEVSSITVMVQKEVADRILANPGDKLSGALTLFVNYYAKATKIIDVGRQFFYPMPNVDSTVIKIDRRIEPKVNPRDVDFMFKIIRLAFNQRRKTLVNALSNQSIGIDKTIIQNSLNQMGLDERIRGERLSLEEFSQLSNMLIQNV